MAANESLFPYRKIRCRRIFYQLELFADGGYGSDMKNFKQALLIVVNATLLWIGISAGLNVLMATTLIAADPSKQDSPKKDSDRIQGTWRVVALETDGKQSPPEIVARLKFVFQEDTLTITIGEPGFTNFIYKLNSVIKPAGFDLTPADGPYKGQTQKGIYSFDGEDRLKICFAIATADKSPNEFTAKAKSGQAMYSLERVK